MKSFEKLKKLGEGSFAEVFLVGSNNKQYVLKEFKNAEISEARREYLFLKIFDSPNIVKVYEFIDSEKPALLLEYIAGKNLADYCKQNEVLDKKSLFLKILKALRDVHNKNIVLNDIKPENILIRDNEPVFIDFGLSTVNFFHDKILRCTPAYAAPEKIKSKMNTLQSDIFSLGILYLYLFNGKIPADDFETDKYLHFLTNKEQWNEYLDSLSVEPFVKKMLDFESLARPNIYEILDYFLPNNKFEAADFIKEYVFDFQLELAKELFEKGIIEIDSFDEPDKIRELVVLIASNKDKNLLILDEKEYLSQPKKFFEKTTSFFEEEITSFTQLRAFLKKHSDIEILIVFYNNFYTKEFENLCNEKCLKINIKDKIDGNYISKEEAEKIYKKVKNFFIENELSDYLPQKASLFRWNFEKESKEIEKNPLGDLLAFLGESIEVDIIQELLPDWDILLKKAMNNLEVKIDGLNISAKKVYDEILPDKLYLQKLIEISEKKEAWNILLNIYLKLNEKDKVSHYFELHLDYLIQNEYYASAKMLIEQMTNFLEWEDLSFDIKKRLAFLLRITGEKERALDIYQELEKNSKNDEEKSLILSDKAVILQELFHYDEALQCYLKAKQIFINLNKTKDLLRVINNIGTLNFVLKKYRDAEKDFFELLRMSEEVNNPQYITFSYMNLSDVLLQTGDWKRCFIFSTKAMEIAKKYKKQTVYFWALSYNLQAAFALGNYERVVEILNEILLSDKALDNKDLLHNLYSHIFYVGKFIDKKYIDRVFEFQKEKDIAQEKELREEMFFWYYQNKKYLECSKLADSDSFFENILNFNIDKIIKALEKSIEINEIHKAWGRMMNLAYSENFRSNEFFMNKIKEINELYPYSPIGDLLDKAKKSDFNPVDEHYDVLWNIINIIHQNYDFKETMRAVLHGIMEIGALERSVFFEFKNGEFEPYLAINKNDKDIPFNILQVSKTLLSETIKISDIRFMTNLQENKNIDLNSSIFGLDLKSAVTFPIIIAERIRGVIYADARGNKEFSMKEKNLIELIFIQAKIALEKSEYYENLKAESERLRTSDDLRFGDIIGNSDAIMRVFDVIKSVSQYNVNVLIQGPTGSGKELVARELHKRYKKDAPFVAVNCAAIPENLLESELFGYKKGAFTGALSDSKGKILQAEGGTLFLDEIGDMAMGLQAKLLRVLQERTITPLGSEKNVPVNVRFIAATNQDLEEMIAVGTFREDLFYRLKVINIVLPSLIERKSDIPLLVRYFIEKFNKKFDKNIEGISDEAMRILQSQKWDGNIRELENEIERALVLCNSNVLDSSDFSLIHNVKASFDFEEIPLDWSEYKDFRKEYMQELDKKYVSFLLDKSENNILKASKIANISRTQIYRLIF